MNPPEEYYNFYFKIAYTERTVYLNFSPDISIKNFIESVRYHALCNFQLENNQLIEVVEAGNPDNINGHDAELAPALIPSNDTLRQIYGDRHQYTAFYIRLIQSHQN